MEAEHIPTPTGKQTWQPATILSILTNEKYKGDALLQKEFTVDFLQKKMKKNEGANLNQLKPVVLLNTQDKRDFFWKNVTD